MSKALLAIPVLLLVFGISSAHAEPLDDVRVNVLEYDGNYATVQMTWDNDETLTKYEMGCVSCIPNTSEFTTESKIILDKVTSFPKTSKAMLYLVAYDSQEEIIDARQFIIDLTR